MCVVCWGRRRHGLLSLPPNKKENQSPPRHACGFSDFRRVRESWVIALCYDNHTRYELCSIHIVVLDLASKNKINICSSLVPILSFVVKTLAVILTFPIHLFDNLVLVAPRDLSKCHNRFSTI